MNRSVRSVLGLGLASVGLLAVNAAPAAADVPRAAATNPISGGLSAPFTFIPRYAPTGSVAGAAARAASGGPLLKPTNPKCVKRKSEKNKPLCGGPFKDKTRRKWWDAPPKFRIVDASIIGTMKMEALSHDDMRFNGEGEVWLSARKGFGGTFKVPKPTKNGIGVGSAVAKPIDWTSRSTGAWITSVGDEYGCGVMLENGPAAPSGLAPLIGANPKKDEISINWNLGGPAYRCDKDLVDPPPFDEEFSDSSLIRYRASSFRGHKLVRLPVTAKWSNESGTTRTTVEWSGHVLLQRVT